MSRHLVTIIITCLCQYLLNQYCTVLILIFHKFFIIINYTYITDTKANLQESQKEQKYEYMDSFRPPSRLKNDFNISIKSEILTGLKKDDLTSAGNSRGSSVNSSTNMSKKFNLSCANGKYPRRRPLNPKTDCYYEEELYVKGCTAVWSKGKSFNIFKLFCFTKVKVKLIITSAVPSREVL